MRIQLAVIGLAASCLALGSAPAAAEVFTLDQPHTYIGFSVKHMVITNVKGRFGEFDGEFEFDPKTKTLTGGRVIIKTASVDTGIAKRDEHLRSEDFFDAVRYPEITWVFTKAVLLGGSQGRVTGDLTIHGITKEVVLTGELLGSVVDPWGNRRVGFTAQGVVNRFDYGLKWNQLLEAGGLVVGEEVRLVIEVEGVAKQ